TRAGPARRPAEISWLKNIRNFAGPDYARVVIDLSDGTRFRASKSGNNKILISLTASVARTLDGRRFIIRDNRFLKHITVAQPGMAGSTVEVEADRLASYTAFELSSPARLVIDLHSTSGITPEAEIARAAARSAERLDAVPSADGVTPQRPAYQPRANLGGAVFSLPDVDVSNLDKIGAPAAEHSPAAATAAPAGSPDATSRTPGTALEKLANDPPIRCTVIDPGHGGHDTGTIGEGGLKEKDLVLDVARKLRDDIKRNFP